MEAQQSPFPLRLTIAMRIPFNAPHLTGQESAYVAEALASRAHCGNHAFGKRCVALLRERYGLGDVFLTPSCTAALEMGVMLANIGPDDEVILPSYTFSSTANAVVRQGARPVFCDVHPDTMNIDAAHIASLITARTKMILPIDYAGIPCDIAPIMTLARNHGIPVMVDAAQSLHATYRDAPAATLPDLAAFSFHETKNFTCGEGGALVVNRPEWVERAHFLQEKGTDRKLVLDGVKSKYHWVDVGSSFLLADVLAAMLLAQLEAADTITRERARVTAAYEDLFAPHERAGHLRIPHPPLNVERNHHAYFVIFDTAAHRQDFLASLRAHDVHAYIGYVPLHSSPMGKRYGYSPEDLPVTEDLASRIVRLPFFTDLPAQGLASCIAHMSDALAALYAPRVVYA